MSMICALDDIENKHDVYRGKDFMKTFYESSNKLAMKIVNFEKKKENDTINKQRARRILPKKV